MLFIGNTSYLVINMQEGVISEIITAVKNFINKLQDDEVIAIVFNIFYNDWFQVEIRYYRTFLFFLKDMTTINFNALSFDEIFDYRKIYLKRILKVLKQTLPADIEVKRDFNIYFGAFIKIRRK